MNFETLNAIFIQEELLDYLENDEIPINDYLKLIQVFNDQKIFFENKQKIKWIFI